jgi:glutathione S-transferase
MSTGPTLTIERTFNAPAQRVFDAFTSEEVMRRWWHAGADWETPEASVDLRIGGEVRVVMRNPHADVSYGGGGVYTEIDPPARLAFTWIWDDDDEHTEQLIVIDFDESGGSTHVTFSHQNLWNEEAVRNHREGWTAALDNLERVLGAG